MTSKLDSFIPLCKPSITQIEMQAVTSALAAGWFGRGESVALFEKKFTEMVAAKKAVAVTSCTAAIHLALINAGLRPGDGVIMPPITWVSPANVVLNMGAQIQFADVLPGTLTLDSTKLEAAITPRTKIIMPVHIAGCPCDMDEINKIARRHKIQVIQDAAHAIGAQYNGKPIGASGVSCFSFHAIKNITTVEGGMLVLQNVRDASKAERLSLHGLPPAIKNKYKQAATYKPLEVQTLGYKYSMGEVAAALGLAQLNQITEFQKKRRVLYNAYLQCLRNAPMLRCLDMPDNIVHGCHLFIVRLNLHSLNCDRDVIVRELHNANIGTGIHFYGLHLHKCYRRLYPNASKKLPVATAASRDILSLPLHTGLTVEQVYKICDILKEALSQHKR